MKTYIKRGLMLAFAIVLGSLISASPVLAAYTTDPPASITQSGDVVTLHKELGGYENYGTDGAADVLYSTEADTWHFNLGAAGITPEEVSDVQVRVALALDDHNERDASEYTGGVALGSESLFNGPFVNQGVQHGAPHGEVFTNWQVLSFTPTSPPTGNDWPVAIANSTSGDVGGDWIAIDWIEIKLTIGTSCDAMPTLPHPDPPFMGTPSGWAADIDVTADDGLVARSVQHDGVVIAEEMSLPYVQVTTVGDTILTRRVQLGTGLGNGRLVAWEPPVPTDVNLTASATFAVKLQEGSKQGCLLVTQTYDFKSFSISEPCEPTELLACVRFRPTVSYEYQGGGLILFSITMPQRLHFTPDANKKKDTGVYKDCETLLTPACLNPFHPGIEVAKDNVQPEFLGRAIVTGQRGDWDNLHITKNESIQAPGCASCVHIHWRWGKAVGELFPDFPINNGKPLIPAGSPQTVHILLVEYKNQESEKDPTNVFTLVDKTPKEGKKEKRWDSVLWYVSTSTANEDTFFNFDAFLGPDVGHDHETI